MKARFSLCRASALALVLISYFPLGSALCRADESPSGDGESAAKGPVSFEKQIEPIFQRNCYGCHQGAKQLGSYLMTDFASLVKGGETGEPAIVPGKPDESYLIDQITSVDGVAEMPKAPAKPLSDVEVELVRRWISEGAKDDSPQDSAARFDADNLPRYNEAPAITSIDISPDGNWIAVAAYHEILLVRVEDGAIEKHLVGISPRINSVSFNADGTKLAAVGGTPGERGEIQIWNPANGELDLSVVFTYDCLCGAAWSPDSSNLAFGATDNVVRAIDTSSGAQVLFQGAHEDWVRDTVLSGHPTGRMSFRSRETCRAN